MSSFRGPLLLLLCAACASEPDSSDFYDYGLYKLYRGDLAAASDSLSRARELAESEGLPRAELGRIVYAQAITLERACDWEPAEETYVEAMSLLVKSDNPRWTAFVLISLGELYRRRGDLDASLQTLADAEAQGPRNDDWLRARLRLSRANTLRDLERFEEAQADYETCLDLFDRTLAPPHEASRAYLQLGTLQLRMGDARAAIDAFERSRDLRPWGSKPLLVSAVQQYAIALQLAGRYEEAKPIQREALELQDLQAERYPNCVGVPL